jgi:hypothetical protein
LSLLAELCAGLGHLGRERRRRPANHARALHILPAIEGANTSAMLVVALGQLRRRISAGFCRSVSHEEIGKKGLESARKSPSNGLAVEAAVLSGNPIKHRNASCKDSTHGK